MNIRDRLNKVRKQLEEEKKLEEEKEREVQELLKKVEKAREDKQKFKEKTFEPIIKTFNDLKKEFKNNEKIKIQCGRLGAQLTYSLNAKKKYRIFVNGEFLHPYKISFIVISFWFHPLKEALVASSKKGRSNEVRKEVKGVENTIDYILKLILEQGLL